MSDELDESLFDESFECEDCGESYENCNCEAEEYDEDELEWEE